MMFLKSCPRCGGDLVLETPPDGTELFCLQCAHRVASRNISARLRRLPADHTRTALKSSPVPAATGT
jgi:transposase